MFLKTAASFSQLSVRRISRISITLTGTRTFASQNIHCAAKTIQPTKPNPVQPNISRYSTKPPVQVMICGYEEVKNLPNEPKKLLIDVREPAELKEFGVIPTSINIPLGVVKQELSPSVSADVFESKYGRKKPDESTEIIFHCRSGKRSGIAAEAALILGYTNVKNYEGSWLDWAEHEGLPK